MFVTIPPRRRRFRLSAPPALLAGLAAFLIAVVALGQSGSTTAPAATPIDAAAPAAVPAAPAPSAITAPALASEAPSSSAEAPTQATEAPTVAPVSDAEPQTPRQRAEFLWGLFQRGGKVMWILAACSVIALAIIFERLYSLRRSRVIPPRFLPGLLAVWRDPRYGRDGAIEYCRRHDSPLARMTAAFFKRLPRGLAAAEKALEDAGANEALKLRQNLRMLYAIGSAATLLGLIGTIAGMIEAFMVTARMGNADNKVEQLSTGIYQAMVCTFGGLAVAVLVTIFYYYFVGRVEKLIGDINDALARFSDDFGLNAESSEELGTTAALPGLR